MTEPATLAEIAGVLGVDRRRIGQIESRAMKRLKPPAGPRRRGRAMKG